MELIVIDDDRMKIMLSHDELYSYNIDALTIDTEDENTKRILYDIIDRARRSAGIDAEYGRMYVQVFASCDGGCEMYVTRYSELYDEEEECCVCEEKNTVHNVRKKRQIFKLDTLGSLVRMCRVLSDSGYSDRSDVYVCDEGESYYIVLYGDDRELCCALEFGRSVSFSGQICYLSEHSDACYLTDAVERFATLCGCTDF